MSAGQPDEGLALWAGALKRPPPSVYAFDPQQERLDLTVAAMQHGRAALAREALTDFLAEEAAMGRPVDPSITALSARVDAALASP